MDRATIIDGLKALGADDESAAKRADAILAESRNVWAPAGRGGGKTFAIERAMKDAEADGVTVYRNVGGSVTTACRFPFRLVLPWSHLVSDNRKYAPAMRGGKPALILTVEYRNAKRLAAIAARTAWGDGATYTEGLELTARVFFPNSYRKRDAHNFQKCAHDALSGIVYDDDSQIVPRWLPAGVAVDAPRAEITITPYHLGV